MHKAIIVRLDGETARALERFVPARSRRQSAFIRRAIRRAIMDLEEVETRRAYEQLPDEEPAIFLPETWERGTTRGKRR